MKTRLLLFLAACLVVGAISLFAKDDITTLPALSGTVSEALTTGSCTIRTETPIKELVRLGSDGEWAHSLGVIVHKTKVTSTGVILSCRESSTYSMSSWGGLTRDPEPREWEEHYAIGGGRLVLTKIVVAKIIPATSGRVEWDKAEEIIIAPPAK